jgi:hypothetical protein
LSVDAVVEIVRAAAQTSGQNISSSLMRMLSKLSSFAERGPSGMQPQAESALREQVRDLITDWKLVDPNPDAYTRALQSMSTEAKARSASGTRNAPEPLRMVQMAIEVGAVGVPFWRAVRQMETDRRLIELVETLTSIEVDNPTAQQLWKHLASERNVVMLLNQPTADFVIISQLLDHMPPETVIDLLLKTLVESEQRGTRMAVYRRLVDIGAPALPRIIELLRDDRWYVQRNMLAMLNDLQHVPNAFAPGDFARHADARVRREAIALWLRVPSDLDRAIVTALKDPDERVLRLGVAAALRSTPESAVPLISSRLAQENLPADIRIQLVRLLGQVRNPLAVDALTKLVVGGKSFLGGVKLAEKSPYMLVALATLVANWQRDPRAQAVIARAAKSKDPEISAAARTEKKS